MKQDFDEIQNEVNKLNEIEDVQQGIQLACSKFSKGEISAKVIRYFFEYLSPEDRVVLIDRLYDKKVRKENMRRLPPKALAPSQVLVDFEDEMRVWGTL